MLDGEIESRKRAHLDLCATESVEHAGKSALFEEIDLLHDSLAGLSLDAVDTSLSFLGRSLRAPFLITGMTGGASEAEAVNRDLAALAERFGIGFGVGSQRAMLRRSDLTRTYSVRDVAPTSLVLANLGLNQAATMPPTEIEAVAETIGADALCLHLNPAQELVQPEGDRSFVGGLETLGRLVRELRTPLIVKETGCGISGRVGRRLEAAGVRYVDVSGAGGTSWVRVEQLRGDARSHSLGKLFRDWGIPTAASLLQLRRTSLVRIASGGVRNGLDAARAIALGAELVGFALPVYRAWCAGGIEGAARFVNEVLEGLRVAMVLTGSPSLEALRRAPIVIGPALDRWRRYEANGCEESADANIGPGTA